VHRESQMFVPTESQLAARDRFLTGESFKIKAFAGCGKTATLQFMANSGEGNGLYVAFNQAIARESSAKFRGKAQCMTTHAMALRHLPADIKNKAGQGLGLNRSQIAAFIRRRCGRDDARPADRVRVVRAALKEFCLSADQEFGLHHVNATEAHLLERVEPARILRDLHAVWGSIADPAGELPLSHDTYLKWFHVHRVPLPYAHALVDEGQDQNAVVIDLLRRSGLQVVWVGDPHQELYAWRGAVNAMATIDDIDEIVLSKCFRFGPKLAELASALLVDLGEYTPLIGNDDIDTVIAKRHQPVRIVRNNMTLLAKIARLSKRHSVFVIGGTARLEKLIVDAGTLMNGKRVASGQLSEFSSWAEVQERAYRRFGHPYTEFVKAVDELGTTELANRLKRLANSEKAAALTLTTVHGSKGCQFSAVSVYDDFRGIKERSASSKPMPADVTRLLYVAITRSKHSLFLERTLANRFYLTQILEAPIAETYSEKEEFNSTESDEPQELPVHQPAPITMLWPPSVRRPPAPEPTPDPIRSAYERYGNFVVGMAIGLFLWILFKW